LQKETIEDKSSDTYLPNNEIVSVTDRCVYYASRYDSLVI